MIVCKFGGSSLANAAQFYKIKKIVEANKERQVIVVSAPGKDESHSTKMTDLLFSCYEYLQLGLDVNPVFDEVMNRFKQIQLECGLDVSDDLENFRAQLNKKSSIDEVVSLGEKTNAQILARYLNIPFVDAKDVIKLNANQSINEDLTFKKIQGAYEIFGPCVIPGFYGSLSNGEIKVLARGGSDITGALCAAALNASAYENWTDVSGVLMADPRIIPYAKSIEQMTYAELRELAFMGASVLHEESIQPVKQKNIPLNIRNTNEPEHAGTIILDTIKQENQTHQFITGVSGLKDFTVLSIHKAQISKSPKLLRDVLEICEQYHLPLELMTKGIDSFTITVKTDKVKSILSDLIQTLKDKCQIDYVKVEDDLALITCVGRRMKYQAGVAGQIFSTLGKNNINIRSIAQGTDEVSILVGVDNKDFETSIGILYEAFIR